jgi:hypothetical protein
MVCGLRAGGSWIRNFGSRSGDPVARRYLDDQGVRAHRRRRRRAVELRPGTNAFSRSAFSAVDVVAITRAPKIRANCRANTDAPPEPWVRTVSPAVTRRSRVRATHAVTAAHGKVAASSKEARSVDERPVRADRIRKSVGAENTFPADLFTYDAARDALREIVDKALLRGLRSPRPHGHTQGQVR